MADLRNNALLRPTEPDVDSPLRIDGELWVNSVTLQMYVFSFDMDGNGTKGWIGVTSGQNNGSIIYSGDTPPTLAEIYPNLENYNIDFPLDPLPGTCWYDTGNNMLKIWWVTPNVGDPNDPDADPYSGAWVSVTTAHFLSEATNAKVAELQSQVDLLTTQVAEMDCIVNGNCP